jgi:hypothetical protein
MENQRWISDNGLIRSGADRDLCLAVQPVCMVNTSAVNVVSTNQSAAGYPLATCQNAAWPTAWSVKPYR